MDVADRELHRPHKMLQRRGAPMLLQRCGAWLPAAALVLLLPALFLQYQGAEALPLSTRGRWVVDAASGQRVKLRCLNWAAHMPAVVPEGLDKQPLDGIVARVAALGFNCVRLTWATYLFTRPRYENLTVAGSFRALGLDDAAAGLAANNPLVSGLTVREAYAEVVRAIGEAGLMAVLDNHVSRPQWCCAGDDGNGFFGDLFFDTEEWLRGLEAVATRFRGTPPVVGMSLRNELRGRNQSEAAWRLHVARGAATIHLANPDVLVIVSGLSYDTDLSFLAARPLPSRFDDKLVLEAHWYSFSRRKEWASRSPDLVCADAAREFDDRAGFVTRPGDDGSSWPLFVSEFGVDQRGANRGDNRFLSCFLAFAAERDLDWALWALQGSYYWRNGQPGFAETYGVLDANWDLPRNPRFQERFRLIQHMLQDPGSQVPAYQIIYHPLSGRCLLADNSSNVLLGDCRSRSKWSYGGNGTAILLAAESSLCLRTVGDGSPVVLSPSCGDNQSAWTMVSGFRIAAMDAGGSQLCLQGSSGNSSTVETGQCLCLGEQVCSENPQTQWFRFLPSNVAL